MCCAFDRYGNLLNRKRICLRALQLYIYFDKHVTPMKKVFTCIILVLAIAACRKSIVPLTLPVPRTDSTAVATATSDTSCTPFMQRTSIQLDAWHIDSALLQLPSRYYANATKKFPILIFLNGVKEGTDYGPLTKLLKWGPPTFMADSLRFSFSVNSEEQSYIVVCPQSANGFRSPLTTNQVIDYMISKYQVDTTRIYLTGLSAGGSSVLRYLSDKPEYAKRIAAAVPMSATFLDSSHLAHLNYINTANVHTLVFCGSQDQKYLSTNKGYVNAINALTPGLAEFKLYKGAHKDWNPMYNPTHKYYNPNMYEWLLNYHK